MKNGTPPLRPDDLDGPSTRVKTRQAQIDRLRLKLERSYQNWLTCRIPELREVLESKVIEYEERIDHLERLNKAARGVE